MYYVYGIEWSVTDFDYVIIYSANDDPLSVLRRLYPTARYYNFICKADKIEK